MSQNKKKALGRGLGALLDVSTDIELSKENIQQLVENGSISFVSIDEIEANPYQPRTNFDSEALSELAASIKEQGIIQPITVRLQGEKYQIISGERRYRASKIAGLVEMPVFIREVNNQEMLEMALVENIQRENLNSIEIAVTYQRLIDECHLTQEAMSERVGKERSTITNYLRLLKLPKEIQNGIIEKKITMGHARALLSIDDQELQIDVFHDITKEDLSVRQVEEIVRNIANDQYHIANDRPINKSKKSLPEKYKHIKDDLSLHLGIPKIQLKRDDKGKGSIVIPFMSDDELEIIVELIKNK